MREFMVENMVCDGCSAAVQKAVTAVDPAARLSIDLATGKVSIDSARSDAEIEAAISAAGFTAQRLG
jgi:copper chaperone